MKNPFGPDPNSLSSYGSLIKRILQHMQAARLNDQVFGLVQKAYEDALRMENVKLSKVERELMLSQVLKNVLSDMLKKLGKGS